MTNAASGNTGGPKDPSVCQVVASINEHIGGPAYSVSSLAANLVDCGFDSHLFSLNYAKMGPQMPSGSAKTHSLDADFIAENFRGYHPKAAQALEHLASDKFNLIHNHGMWMFPNLYARAAALKAELPLIISPRGMVEAWSLKRSVFRKFFAWHCYERKNLASASAFHATSQAELESLRALGMQQAIAVIPNGVSLPDLTCDYGRKLLEDDFPLLKGKKWLLFMSRLHPKKGLDLLIKVWKELYQDFPDWHLIIAGPDLIVYQSSLERLVRELDLSEHLSFTGILSGDRKKAALKNSELFVLPTYSENFGIVVAEALAYEVPVLSTTGTPWEVLNKERCGWWINLDNLKETLQAALKLSEQERKEMGQRGRALVEKNYTWATIAKQMAEFYSWILKGGAKPDFVQCYND